MNLDNNILMRIKYNQNEPFDRINQYLDLLASSIDELNKVQRLQLSAARTKLVELNNLFSKLVDSLLDQYDLSDTQNECTDSDNDYVNELVKQKMIKVQQYLNQEGGQ